jgi:hypothetical protein
MKAKLLLTIALLLGLNSAHWAQSAATHTDPQYPYMEVVIMQDKIWLLPDETPMADLPVQVLNAAGKVVVQKVFTIDTEDWSLDVSTLSAGKYKILIGSNQVEYLDKQGRKGML